MNGEEFAKKIAEHCGPGNFDVVEEKYVRPGTCVVMCPNGCCMFYAGPFDGVFAGAAYPPGTYFCLSSEDIRRMAHTLNVDRLSLDARKHALASTRH